MTAEQQRLSWLLSMPACAQVNQAMQELTGVNYNTGEQNKDMSKARQAVTERTHYSSCPVSEGAKAVQQ